MFSRLVVVVTILFAFGCFGSFAWAQDTAVPAPAPAPVPAVGSDTATPSPAPEAPAVPATEAAPAPAPEAAAPAPVPEAADPAPAPAEVKEEKESYKVYFFPSKLGPKYKGVENLAGEFLLKDKRFQIVRSVGEADYSIEIKLNGNKISVVATIDGPVSQEQVYEADLGPKFADLALMGEVRRGLRNLTVYQPEKSKAMVKLYAFSEGEEGDAGQVESNILDTIRIEYEEVLADPYKFAIKAADIKALLKASDMKALRVFKDNGIDVVIFGVLDMPTVKDVGGSAENLFQGTMHAEIKVIDTATGRIYSYVKSDFTGNGQYSELQFNLMEGAGKYVAETLWKELGLPKADDGSGPATDEEGEPNMDGERTNGPTFD